MVKETDSTVKKRRKTSASAANNLSVSTVQQKLENVDLYQSVIDFEENEAKSRDAEIDHKLYMKTCDEFRKIVSEIAKLKSQHTEKAKAEIKEKRIQGSLLFVTLKKLNRLEKFRTRETRDSLNSVKQQVDSYHLQLQNLLYEILHLKKEVNRCLQFKSKDEEIDLVSLEQFFKDAPESISRPNVTKNDEHQLKLARLEWELQERKQLSSQCQKMEEAKKEAGKEIVAMQERLDSLNPQLKSLLDQTAPLQDFLKLPLDKIRKQHRVARLLPKPLFVLYVQADAYRQAFDPLVTVLIIGDEDAARILTPEAQETADDESDSELENSSGFQESSSSRRRKASTRTDRQVERRRQLVKPHPLTVEVTMKRPEGNAIVLTFLYLTNLKIITVQIKVDTVQPVHGIAAGDLIASHRILASLLPGDTGACSPNPANAYQLRRAGLDSLPDDAGIPYKWAQRIAGIEVVGENTPIGNESLFRKIKRRLDGRIALCRQIQQLEGGHITVPSAMRSLFPTKLGSNLRDFRSLTWADYVRLGHTSDLVAENKCEPEDSFYKAVLVRGSAKLTALITVKANYPQMPAVFCLLLAWQGDHTAKNHNAIRDLECEMNVHWKEYPQLLSAQLLRLQTSLDILLESSCVDLNPAEFPRDKVFFRAVRGRERSVPYKYLATGGGVFTHR